MLHVAWRPPRKGLGRVDDGQTTLSRNLRKGQAAGEAGAGEANEEEEAGDEEEGERTPESTPGWDTVETVANDTADCVSTSAKKEANED